MDVGRHSGLSGDDLALLQRGAQRLLDAGPAAATVRTLLAMADELLAAEDVAAPHI